MLLTSTQAMLLITVVSSSQPFSVLEYLYFVRMNWVYNHQLDSDKSSLLACLREHGLLSENVK